MRCPGRPQFSMWLVHGGAVSAQKKVEDTSTLVPEHKAQMAAEQLQCDFVEQLTHVRQSLSKAAEAIPASVRQLSIKFQKITIHPAWSAVSKGLVESAELLEEFKRDLNSSKLGELDEEPFAQCLARYWAVRRVCKGLPPPWPQTPGDVLHSFSVPLNQVPMNWAPSNPIKGFISLRSGIGAMKVNLPHKEAKSHALELARNLWAKDERLTKEEIADQIVLVLRRDGHGERSVGMILEWIKGAVPESRKKGGRPKKGI